MVIFGSTGGLITDGHQRWREGDDGLQGDREGDDLFGFELGAAISTETGSMILRRERLARTRRVGLDAEKNFRKIMGYRDLWMLDKILNPASSSQQEAA